MRAVSCGWRTALNLIAGAYEFDPAQGVTGIVKPCWCACFGRPRVTTANGHDEPRAASPGMPLGFQR